MEKLPIVLSKGIKKHLVKHKHEDCIDYIPSIPEMLQHPDYIGRKINNFDNSVEFIKKFDDNISVAIKLDCEQQRYYVATLYSLQDSKLQSRLKSERYKPYN